MHHTSKFSSKPGANRFVTPDSDTTCVVIVEIHCHRFAREGISTTFGLSMDEIILLRCLVAPKMWCGLEGSASKGCPSKLSDGFAPPRKKSLYDDFFRMQYNNSTPRSRIAD